MKTKVKVLATSLLVSVLALMVISSVLAQPPEPTSFSDSWQPLVSEPQPVHVRFDDPERLLQQRTSSVKAGEGWGRAVLEFTTPEWDPFINIVFVLEGEGRAWMDDFSLMEAAQAPAP